MKDSVASSDILIIVTYKDDLSDYVTNLGTEFSYLDDNIIVYKTNKLFDGPILACEYFEENNLSYDMNTFRSTKFKYLGSGKLKMIDDDFMTLRDYFDYYYHFDSCEDLLTAWNNGDFNYWKNSYIFVAVF